MRRSVSLTRTPTSLSMMVRVTIYSTWLPPSVALTATNTRSSGSSSVSSVGVKVNAPLPLLALAGISKVKSATLAKSVPPTAVTPATLTVTSVGVRGGVAPALKAAVTVISVAPSPSFTWLGLRLTTSEVGGVGTVSTWDSA